MHGGCVATKKRAKRVVFGRGLTKERMFFAPAKKGGGGTAGREGDMTA